MTTALLRRVVFSGAACITVLSCSGGGGSTPPKKGGVFAITLSGAQADDGAILFHIGPGAGNVSVSGAPALRVQVASRGGGYHVVALGPLQASVLVRVTVPDADVPPTLSVLEVAASDGTLRTVLSTYALSAALQP